MWQGRTVTAASDRFVEVYERFYQPVYLYCRRRTSLAKVDDAVAETFLAAWRLIEEIPVGDAALPWLYKVAYRRLMHQWRSGSRRHRLEKRLASLGVEMTPTPDDYAMSRHDSQLILQAASLLRRADQEILRLSLWEELDHDDVAAVLDINNVAVRQRLSRALKNLTREHNRLETRQVTTPAAQKGGAW